MSLESTRRSPRKSTSQKTSSLPNEDLDDRKDPRRKYPLQVNNSLRSGDKQLASAPIVIDSSSDEDMEFHNSMYAFLASEISFLQAISGPDATKWKEAIYDEMKSLVANDTWELVDRLK